MSRESVVGVTAILVLLTFPGCGPSPSQEANVEAQLALEPSPPVVGDAKVMLKLVDPQGAPVAGAQVRVEGNMNHAGMKPSFADLKEEQPGQYAGTLEFTMGGDWFILATARLVEGGTVEHKFDVPGVKSP